MRRLSAKLAMLIVGLGLLPTACQVSDLESDPCALVEYEMGEGLGRGDGLKGVALLYFESEHSGPNLEARRGGRRLEMTLRYEDLGVCRDRFAPRWFEVFEDLVALGRAEARETLQLIVWSGAHRDARFEGRMARVFRMLAAQEGQAHWGGETDWVVVGTDWGPFSGFWRELLQAAGPSLFGQLEGDGTIDLAVLWRLRESLSIQLAKVPSEWSAWAEGAAPYADAICGAEPRSGSARAALEWDEFVRVWLPSTLGVVCPIGSR